MTGNDEESNRILIQFAKNWLESVATGQKGREMERQAVQNLYSIHVQKGLIQCNFIDGDGNWHVGAIAPLTDHVGASVVHTTHADIHVSEEVEIEAKVLAHKGNLSSVMVVIKKK
ncbi:hypothetical protein MKW98_009896 [Papaver atlanticum]|uniref:Uncharacterized protein n=1 Tax=Papaver atlanticum TaxID=357466 RepID=A0AAD4T398_9MAGN|nr:hypothetical protein MKW98_009896 [Papaver atlanticum]